MTSRSISAKDFELYVKYDGDLTDLSHSKDRGAKVTKDAWQQLEDLRTRAVIAATGKGSRSFRERLESDCDEKLPDSSVRKQFEQLIKRDIELRNCDETGSA